ncbi:MAG TPA: hypothetical protein VER12_16305 [Polyangiaceae bacterium]|nr:hypothetical protein [Polyangiaceae bacterium]
MTNFDDELRQLRTEVIVPDGEATKRVAARLSRSIGALAVGPANSGPPALAQVRPLQLLASLVVGGVVGAGVYAAFRPPRVVYIERPPVPVSSSATSAATALNAVPTASAAPEFTFSAASQPSARASASSPSASSGGGRLSSLAEQQALLDVARAAFARSDYSATLQTLTRHSARFPKSALAEEREALQIKALAGSDRLQEARALAAHFRAQHPQSLLLPSIRDSVGTIP